MPENAGNPLSFFQELKRRKVVRVIIVYAAASFVILELASIIQEPFGLPDWTIRLVFILLLIGLIITIILSWLYDITPEGIEKTKPVHQIKEKTSEKPTGLNAWKIASYISFLVIVGLIILNIIPRTGKKEILETSIAVLPLVNLSSNDDISSIGFTNEIIMELQKIKAFSRVLSLTSTMQFEEHQPTIPEIGQILNVNYIIEGTIQKQHDRISIIIQVISAKEDDHIWAEEFKDAWENRFNLQDQIALVVAEELQAVITPEEKQLIDKVPTTSLTAYDFYQRGQDEYHKYKPDIDNREALEKAENLFYKALEYDSTFALAYTGMARVYWDKYFWETYYSDDFLDSVIILADIALYYDDRIANAYDVKGRYYLEFGKPEQARKEFDKAIKFNPNDYRAYEGKAQAYLTDYVSRISLLHKAASLTHGPELPYLLGEIGNAYRKAGFPEKARFYFEEALKLDGDSSQYYFLLTKMEFALGNFEKTIECGLKVFAIDSLHPGNLFYLGGGYLFNGQKKESLEYFEKLIERDKTLGQVTIPGGLHYIGYAYWQNGFSKEADYYFNEAIKAWNRYNELKETRKFVSYQHLASIYAFRGEREKAFENLRIFNQEEVKRLGMVTTIKYNPLFDSIKDEPEFEQIVRDVEAKHRVQHKRVRKWLEENNML